MPPSDLSSFICDGYVKSIKVMSEKLYGDNNRCQLISNSDVRFLSGKVKTVIDSAITAESQNKATKDMLDMMLWDWFNFIVNHRTDHLSEKEKWYKDNK